MALVIENNLSLKHLRLNTKTAGRWSDLSARLLSASCSSSSTRTALITAGVLISSQGLAAVLSRMDAVSAIRRFWRDHVWYVECD